MFHCSDFDSKNAHDRRNRETYRARRSASEFRVNHPHFSHGIVGGGSVSHCILADSNYTNTQNDRTYKFHINNHQINKYIKHGIQLAPQTAIPKKMDTAFWYSTPLASFVFGAEPAYPTASPPVPDGAPAFSWGAAGRGGGFSETVQRPSLCPFHNVHITNFFGSKYAQIEQIRKYNKNKEKNICYVDDKTHELFRLNYNEDPKIKLWNAAMKSYENLIKNNDKKLRALSFTTLFNQKQSRSNQNTLIQNLMIGSTI